MGSDVRCCECGRELDPHEGYVTPASVSVPEKDKKGKPMCLTCFKERFPGVPVIEQDTGKEQDGEDLFDVIPMPGHVLCRVDLACRASSPVVLAVGKSDCDVLPGDRLIVDNLASVTLYDGSRGIVSTDHVIGVLREKPAEWRKRIAEAEA